MIRGDEELEILEAPLASGSIFQEPPNLLMVLKYTNLCPPIPFRVSKNSGSPPQYLHAPPFHIK